MNKWVALSVLALASMVGCAEPPAEVIQEAKKSIADAEAAKAEQYASEALRSAEDAQARLDSELKAQEERFALFRSYDKAEQLAAEVKTASAKAAQEAREGEQRAKQAASDRIAELKSTIDEVAMLLEQAPTGKGTAADIAALRGDVESIRSSIGDIEQSYEAGDYKMATARADAARQSADEVRAEITAAIEAAQQAKKGGRRT